MFVLLNAAGSEQVWLKISGVEANLSVWRSKNKKKDVQTNVFFLICEKGGSNPHPLYMDQPLKLTRLPIPPSSQNSHRIALTGAAFTRTSLLCQTLFFTFFIFLLFFRSLIPILFRLYHYIYATQPNIYPTTNLLNIAPPSIQF